MLHLAVALSILCSRAASQDAADIKAELRDVPAEGKRGASVACDGTSNLPNGALLHLYLYFDRINEGREISKDTAVVKGGKFSADLTPFPAKNLPGRYVLRIVYNPDLQDQAFPGFKVTRVETTTRFGAPEDFEREAKAIRARLVADIHAFTALSEEVKAKMTELKGKPAEAWKPLLDGWAEKGREIQKRADPRAVPEYNVLNLDLVATSGLENLAGILNSAAVTASAGNAKEALEGLTVLRQTAEYWAGEIASPKLTETQDILDIIDEARKQSRDALAKPDASPLPARRRVIEICAILTKSYREDFHPAIQDINARAAAFFAALADKDPNAKALHAELDQALEKLAAPLRPSK